MKIVHLSDIHVWRYTWDLRHLLGRRALGMIELLMGRARRFQLDRLAAVVDRVTGLKPDHILITGDLTTTALPSEFREVARLLGPLLTDPARVSVIPGNHDRATERSFRCRRFEGTFGAFMPALVFPWLRRLDSDTAILGLDPTRPRFSPRGRLPVDQLAAAQAMTSKPNTRPKTLIVACHYPVAAPCATSVSCFASGWTMNGLFALGSLESARTSIAVDMCMRPGRSSRLRCQTSSVSTPAHP